MHINKVLDIDNDLVKYNKIKTHCNQFILESNNLPLYRALPTRYGDLKRVKVRHKKQDPLAPVYDALQHNVRKKTVFAYSAPPTPALNEDVYYVFPINGYKFLYSTEIENSSKEMMSVLETLIEQYDEQQAKQLIETVLKLSYTDVMLEEGIRSGCEIMLHGVPAYYAVRASSINYDKLLTIITS